MTDHNLVPEIGKRYVRRDGTVTPVLTECNPVFNKLFYKWGSAYDPEHHYVFNTSVDNGDKAWRINPASTEDHEHDLMEEYKDA